MTFRSDRVVVQYTPGLDIHGRRWDEAIKRITKVRPRLTEADWAQFDGPLFSTEAEGTDCECPLANTPSCACTLVEFYVLVFPEDMRDTWDIESRIKSPSLSHQVEVFLQTKAASV
jgi:hypothetical protein